MKPDEKEEPKKPYEPPKITHELDLETRAGSPPPCPDSNITGIPCE